LRSPFFVSCARPLSFFSSGFLVDTLLLLYFYLGFLFFFFLSFFIKDLRPFVSLGSFVLLPPRASFSLFFSPSAPPQPFSPLSQFFVFFPGANFLSCCLARVTPHTPPSWTEFFLGLYCVGSRGLLSCVPISSPVLNFFHVFFLTVFPFFLFGIFYSFLRCLGDPALGP